MCLDLVSDDFVEPEAKSNSTVEEPEACLVLINSVLLNLLCVWILFQMTL